MAVRREELEKRLVANEVDDDGACDREGARGNKTIGGSREEIGVAPGESDERLLCHIFM